MFNKLSILSILCALVFALGACSSGGGSSGGAAATPPPGGGGGGGGGGTNTPPVITSSAPTTATEGQLYSYQAAANDAEGDPLTWSLTSGPSGMTVSASGLVQWTPSSAQVGSHGVTIDVNDGTVSASDSWTITVSAAGGGGGGGGSAGSTPTNGSGGSTGTVNGSYNGRSYRAHVPSSYSASTPTPVVIALHGSGDTYTNFHATLAAYGWTSAANSNGFILLTPDNMNSSRPSFLHLTSTGGLDANGTNTEIAGVIETAYYGLGADYNVETEEIYMIGFSEGGVVTDIAAYWYSKEIKAVAPYAGAATGKSFPIDRDIPVYVICGTNDSGYSGSQTTYTEWTNATHSTNNAWVSGVGHSFGSLCTSGPSPSSVYSWMESASYTTAVTSAYQSGGGSGGGGSGGGGSGASNPTNGTGGAYPGNQTRNVTVSSLGSYDYYLYVPSSYNPSTPMPVMFAFHGAGGTGTSPAAAQQARNDWATVASSNGFIVVAQASTGTGGGWVPNNDSAILNAIITDVFGAYNIEQNRVHAWGFSAGGHFIHALALQNANIFASYGVSAGVLQALAGTTAPSSASRQIPVDIHVGSSDSLQPYASSDKTTFQNAGWTLNSDLFYTEFSGGHTYTTSHLSEIWNNIGGFSLP